MKGSPIGLLLSLTYGAVIATNQFIYGVVDTDSSPTSVDSSSTTTIIVTDSSPETFKNPSINGGVDTQSRNSSINTGKSSDTI